MSPKRAMWIKIVLIWFVALFVYANSLDNGFIYDDEFLIVRNPIVKSYSNIPSLFTHHFFEESPMESSIKLYRPMTTLSYLLTYQLFRFEAFYYHLMNVVVHAVNSVLVFVFCLALFDKSIHKQTVGVIAGLLFAVHPIHTESVAFISGRTDVLATFFVLLTLITYLAWRKNGRVWFYVISCVMFVCAVLSKEVSLVVPGLVIIIEYWRGGKGLKEWRRTDIANVIFGVCVYCLIAVGYLSIRVFLIKLPMPPYPTGSFFTCVLLMQKVFLHYMRLLVFPVNLIAGYRSFFRVPMGLFELPVILAIAANMGAIILATWALRRRSVFGFGFFWILAGLLPVLNLLPLGITCAERYLYLPSIGFCIIAADIIRRVGNRKAMWVVVGVVAIVLSGLTIRRNEVWSDAVVLWEDTLRKNPDNINATTRLAVELVRRGEYASAKVYAKQLLDSDQTDERYLQHELYAKCLIGGGEYEKALEHLNLIASLAPDYDGYLTQVGRAYMGMNDLRKAEEVFREAFEKDDNLVAPRLKLIEIYIDQGRFGEALQLCDEAIKIDPHIAERYGFNIDGVKGNIYQHNEEWEKAEASLAKAVKLDPGNVQMRFNLAFVYDGLSEKDAKYLPRAAEQYMQVLALKENHIDAMINLGIICARTGNSERARALWERVLEVDPANETAHENLKILDRSIPSEK